MNRFNARSVLWAGIAAVLAGNSALADGPASVMPQEKDRGRHEQFLKDKAALLKKGPIQVVFIGDSITDGWRGGGHATWQTAFGDKYNALNLGIGGDQTQHVLWRIAHGELDGISPKVVVMMIGTNNCGSPAVDMVAGVVADVAAVHAKLPHAKILLLGIFPRATNPRDGARVKINQVNEVLSKLDGKDNVKYLDIGAKFLEADSTLPASIMPDALHPNEKGYAIWADEIGPTLQDLAK